MDSSDKRITPQQIDAITDIFICLYKDGEYDPVDGERTAQQRKTLKHTFKKQFKNDSSRFSTYYTCIFQALIDADLKRVCSQRRRIKQLVREQEESKKNMELQKELMKNEVRREVKEELMNGHFKELAERCERLNNRISEYNKRLIEKNNVIDQLKDNMAHFVPREDFDKLQEEYYNLKQIKDKQNAVEKKKDDKKEEERKKKIEALQKKKEALEKEEAELEKLLNDDSSSDDE